MIAQSVVNVMNTQLTQIVIDEFNQLDGVSFTAAFKSTLSIGVDRNHEKDQLKQNDVPISPFLLAFCVPRMVFIIHFSSYVLLNGK